MTDDLYRETIIAEARQPQNYGALQDPDVAQSQVNPSCGDSIQVTLKLDSGKHRIVNIGWEGSGCVVSMASMSFLSAKVKNLTVAEVQALIVADLKQMLGIDYITPSREKCMLMGLMAIQQALVSGQELD